MDGVVHGVPTGADAARCDACAVPEEDFHHAGVAVCDCAMNRRGAAAPFVAGDVAVTNGGVEVNAIGEQLEDEGFGIGGGWGE